MSGSANRFPDLVSVSDFDALLHPLEEIEKRARNLESRVAAGDFAPKTIQDADRTIDRFETAARRYDQLVAENAYWIRGEARDDTIADARSAVNRCFSVVEGLRAALEHAPRPQGVRAGTAAALESYFRTHNPHNFPEAVIRLLEKAHSKK